MASILSFINLRFVSQASHLSKISLGKNFGPQAINRVTSRHLPSSNLAKPMLRDISCCTPLKTNNIPPENLEDDPASFWKWFLHSVKNGCISNMGDILTVACFIHWEKNTSFPRTTATLSRQTIIHRGT